MRVQNLFVLNKALRYGCVEKGAFTEAVSHRQVWERSGYLCSLGMREGYGIGLWKAIRRGWDAFKINIYFVVGNGNKWLDLGEYLV